ncbi:hypothetical protein C3L33_03599, partial [Rhododendron williamsianum]
MVGEGIYGVGPVLAALSAGRREFYALYVQEGLDLSGNNRKKKDKKGFERVLRIAEKIALSKKEVSKHDLNMVVDSRPHQGLVLDASPLDMVGIKELDPVPMGQEKAPLWVALDEVEPNAPTILVLGSEGTGLRPLVERSCTQLVRIPGNFPVDISAGLKMGKVQVRLVGTQVRVPVLSGGGELECQCCSRVLLHHLIGSNSNDDQTGNGKADLLE